MADYLNLLPHMWRTRELERLPISSALLLCGDDDRGYVFAGRSYSQLLDSVNERLVEAGISTATIAVPYSAVHGSLAYGRVFAVNGLLSRATIRDRIQRIVKGRSHPPGESVIRAWGKVLEKIDPSILIGIQPPPELCIAARRRGVWVADLQHGLLSDEGYYGRALRARFGQAGWPDCILCWDEASAAWASERLPSSVAARVIGNPWILRFLHLEPTDQLVMAACQTVPSTKIRPIVLVSLQWGFEGSPGYDDTGLPRALTAVIRDPATSYDWWLRLHPMMLRYPQRARLSRRLSRAFTNQPNVTWQSCSDAPLPLLLQYIDAHITSHSAVTIEASWFGVRTALLDNREDLLTEWFGQQMRLGWAEIVQANPTAISSWLESNVRESRRTSPSTSASRQELDMFIEDMALRARQPEARARVLRATGRAPSTP